jgi:hypothetical protein
MNPSPPLSTSDRAFAVAAVRALGARAEGACARRSPALRRLAVELARDPARLTAEAVALARPVPVGIGEVHASWFTPPPPSRRADAALYLQRRGYGHLVETAVDSDPADPADKLEQRSAMQVPELLRALGRRRVATAFSGAPRGALAQLCARLGEPAAGELLAEVRALASQVSPEEVVAAQRALSHPGVDALEDARDLFLRVGMDWLAPALRARGGDRLQRFAQRLPLPLGRALVAAAARAPAPDGEGGAALAAAAAALATLRPRAL